MKNEHISHLKYIPLHPNWLKMSKETLKEKTAKGLMWGAVNNLSIQVLSALIGIVLGRILCPAEYGMVGMLAIFSAVAATLSESGFTAAITNLKEVSHREYNAVFWFSTFCSLLLYAVLYFIAPLIADFFHQPALVDLSRLVFASFVMAGIGTAHSAYMFRNMMNREKAIMNSVAVIVSGAVGITLAFNDFSYWSLAWQQFAYISIIDIGRLYYVRWLPSLHFDFSPIRQMFGFSSKILITGIVNQVNNNVLSFILGHLFLPKDVGNYSQAAKWNNMGHSLITGTIQQVAQPVMASISDEGDNRQINVFRKMLRFTAFLSMPAMFTLAIVADFIVVLLGDKWSESVSLLRILCISGAFLPIQALYQSLFISHGRSDTYMWATLSQILVLTGTVIAFSPFGIQKMVMACATIQILWVGVWQVLAKRVLALSNVDIIKDIVPFLFIALICTGIAYLTTQNILILELRIVVRILITALLYIGVMKIAHVKIFDECIQFLLKRFHH